MTSDILPPGSTIGVLGGGQLGRMIALAAADQVAFLTRALSTSSIPDPLRSPQQ